TISITAQLPGASAETMAASVASPIERQLSTIAGITSITSASSLGRTNIVVQFDLNRNIDGAALDEQTALTGAQRRLPIEITGLPLTGRQRDIIEDAAHDALSLRRDHGWAAGVSASGRRARRWLGEAEVRSPRASRSGAGGGTEHFAR